MNMGVSDPDTFMPLALMHPTPMNATTMVEIFHEMVVDLPSVLDMLQESITALDSVVSTVSTNDPGLEGEIDNVALQFAASHLIIAPLAILFGDFGVHGWVTLCKRLLLKNDQKILSNSFSQSTKRWSVKAVLFLKMRYVEIWYKLTSTFQDSSMYLFKWPAVILNASQDTMVILFMGNQAQQTMELGSL
ncbi:hypothetical protein EDC04DRAFT_2598142 [Pisolithus marmoratus]|nr:hypothetical protein EDC04DRAFT_2598142 [Pisolithus marmoratus]